MLRYMVPLESVVLRKIKATTRDEKKPFSINYSFSLRGTCSHNHTLHFVTPLVRNILGIYMYKQKKNRQHQQYIYIYMSGGKWDCMYVYDNILNSVEHSAKKRMKQKYSSTSKINK